MNGTTFVQPLTLAKEVIKATKVQNKVQHTLLDIMSTSLIYLALSSVVSRMSLNFPMVLTTPTLHSKLPRIHSSVICKESEGGRKEGGWEREREGGRGRGRKREEGKEGGEREREEGRGREKGDEGEYGFYGATY